MAVVADIDSIDLVVEPHEFSPEDRDTRPQQLAAAFEPAMLPICLNVNLHRSIGVKRRGGDCE